MQQVALCVFLVHEFRSSESRERGTKPERLARNQAALNRLLDLLGATGDPTRQLVGPILLPGNSHVPAGMPLYVGKAIRNLG